MFSPTLGRWIQNDPIEFEAGDPNLYRFVGNSPTNMTDPSGLAPNQAGTTDPSHILKAIKAKMKQGKSKEEILREISDEHGSNMDRYFYTKKYGWVDIRHFAKAAQLSLNWSRTVVETEGFLLESVQWLSEWGDSYRSGFSPEDLPSNSAGTDFGKNHGRVDELDIAFKKWLETAGGLPQNDPIANKEKLPMTDPSEKGGKGRGSSNLSSTGPDRVPPPKMTEAEARDLDRSLPGSALKAGPKW